MATVSGGSNSATSSCASACRFRALAKAPGVPRRRVLQGRTFMTVSAPDRSGPTGILGRILVAGSDLLADALGTALETYGFATMNIVARKHEIERAIGWRPDLVLIDARFLDVPSGSALIGELRRVGLHVCVIDKADNADRSDAWLEAGTTALIDESEPFDQLFRTVTLVLRVGILSHAQPQSSAAFELAAVDERRDSAGLDKFAGLTQREQVVLAELIEGSCAEEIANQEYVSISTVRSQIKAILQKLGVNSQLAAVAMARRAGWSLDRPPGTPPEPSSGRRRRVS